MGSMNFPKFVTRLYLRAIFPSKRSVRLAAQKTTRATQRSAAAALSLREADSWQPILENIVMTGLPQVQELVFSGRWNKKDGGDKRPEQRSR